MENKAEVFAGRTDKYNSPEPWGKFVWGRSYVCGAIYRGKIIYNWDKRSSVIESLRDSAMSVYGRMRWHKCLEYNLQNGFLIDETNQVVPCEPLSPEEETVFRETLEGKLKEKR